ncbi:T9SS type A sorting domain-containing protein [Winogradskyella psychrotolerans]|uniref:T9SS type A sorting domain-containing protein n=1 Tax=Winogradskyella psychrotolerans TaxID=1344585 RepID=UPI001C066024|nr:T9SS type A sorting domain-containing protein [Winogradskyella psychrotolerans]MBU2926684.1 T9SS type A sorting domain-containing protein [Winogradskyella psychrotolerans]
MKKLLLLTLLLCVSHAIFYAQECSYGTYSEGSANGENISTGGLYEYMGAVDFDVPFGETFTTDEITVNLLKGDADLNYVNVFLVTESEGLPGDIIVGYTNLIPSEQDLEYTTEIEGLDVYKITLNLEAEVTLETGKYFIALAASAGDENGAWWEIASENQTYGLFDYNKFDDEPWGGTGYYNKVFQIIGTCEDSGDEPAELGEVCSQGNSSVTPENGQSFFANNGQVISIADDFIVAENTTFNLTRFTMDALLTGGGMHNATINIRTTDGNAPGEILHSFINKGPDYEEYQGYWSISGYPFELVSVRISFTFQDAIALTEGSYFIEVIPTPNTTDLLTWELTSSGGIGGSSYTSIDGGFSWDMNSGSNQIFTVDGFCEDTLSVDEVSSFSTFNYFPNPVSDILNVSAQSKFSNLELYNVMGQKIDTYDANTSVINTRGLASGIYMLKVQFENGRSETFEIIKK